ncbi:hypothetical protein BsWGS_18676 [Bradybaena similaris]
MAIQDVQHVVMLYLATILIFIGIFTSAWSVNWRVHNIDVKSGLFKHCVIDHCVDHDGDKTVKGFEMVGGIAAGICCICMTVHQAMKHKSNSVVKSLPKATFYLSIAGAGLVFLGCAIYAFDKYGDNIYPGYSFVLALIGGVVLVAAGAASSRK